MQRFEAFGRLDQRRRRFDPVLQQPAQLQRDRSLPLQLVMLRSRLGYWIAANKAARVVTLPLLVTRPPRSGDRFPAIVIWGRLRLYPPVHSATGQWLASVRGPQCGAVTAELARLVLRRLLTALPGLPVCPRVKAGCYRARAGEMQVADIEQLAYPAAAQLGFEVNRVGTGGKPAVQNTVSAFFH
jgi:hypothetical protein